LMFRNEAGLSMALGKQLTHACKSFKR